MSKHKTTGLINAFWLKLIMAVLMVLDHLYYNLLPQLHWAHIAARVVAPVFCYLVTEGMVYTRNRQRYILRIFTFGAAMMAGNAILFLIFGSKIQNSILMTLGISAAVIACIDNARETSGGKTILWILAAAGLFVASSPFEGGKMIPLMAIIFYYLRENRVLMWAVYVAVFCLPYLLAWQRVGLPSQFWMILAIIPIALYNGQRGRSGPVAKYFFYVFYPLHIWIIFLIEQAVL